MCEEVESSASSDPEELSLFSPSRSAYVSGWDDDVEGIEVDSNPHSDPHKESLWAAENNKLELVKSLVEKDYSLLQSTDSDGYTPLHRASYNHHHHIVRYLLTKGADVCARTNDGWQPLHSACRWNSYRCASLLLDAGADINALSNGGQTPLHLAASHSNAVETLKLLLFRHDLNPTLRNASGDTAEEIARRSGSISYLFQLVDPSINII